MSYKALYRTYRPQKFSEVIGQEAIVKTLQNSILSGKISHAYLFTGPRGTGKTTVARILAKGLNCENKRGPDPCGKCLICQEIASSSNPDVVEIDAASNNGVEDIRDIREKVKFLPSGSKYKIYIIDEVHMLSLGAFNALLKTLEEPPKHVVFILATTEPHKILPTIISRCQRYDFKALSVKNIAELVKKVATAERFHITEEAIIAIAEGAEGGMRDALGYLDQAVSFTDNVITIDDVNSVTGNLNYDKMIELAQCFENKDIKTAIKTVNDLVIMGKEINKIVSGMIQFYRDVLLYKNIKTSMFARYIFEKEDFKKLVDVIHEEKIFYYVDALTDMQTKIRLTTAPLIYLEVALIKMINEYDTERSDDARIQDIEMRLGALGNGNMLQDKVGSLEMRLTRLVDELHKLDLPAITEKIKGIDEALSADNSRTETSETMHNELKSFKDDMERLINEQTNRELEHTLREIKEKITAIETIIYSEEPAPLVQPVKKARSRVSDGQIGLFGSDEEFGGEEKSDEVNEETANRSDDVNRAYTEVGVEDGLLDKAPAQTDEKQKGISRKTSGERNIFEGMDSVLVKGAREAEEPIVNISAMTGEKSDPEAQQENDRHSYKNTLLRGMANDDYSNYHVEVIERILHDSQSEPARKDKARLVEVWKTLHNDVVSEQLDIVDLLQEGQIVAVGNKEFILIYPNVSLCNQVMRLRFKYEALAILNKILGDDYNYLAIPDTIWTGKRNEYINQYNIGIKFPKLSPINEPGLNVRQDNLEYLDHQEKLVDRAIKLFGENLVKIRQ